MKRRLRPVKKGRIHLSVQRGQTWHKIIKTMAPPPPTLWWLKPIPARVTLLVFRGGRSSQSVSCGRFSTSISPPKCRGFWPRLTGLSDFANVVAQARYIHLAFAITLATLAFPLFKTSPRDRIPAYDWALLILGVSACLYLVVFRYQIADRPGLWSRTDVTMSAIGMGVLLISVYRSLGLPLVIIASAFVMFAFFGGYSEWARNITNYGGASLTKRWAITGCRPKASLVWRLASLQR